MLLFSRAEGFRKQIFVQADTNVHAKHSPDLQQGLLVSVEGLQEDYKSKTTAEHPQHSTEHPRYPWYPKLGGKKSKEELRQQHITAYIPTISAAAKSLLKRGQDWGSREVFRAGL